MDRTRIRWSNVGRLAAAVGGAAALIAVLPGLLTPPEPEPLPTDVGLVAGTSGAHAPPKPSRTARRGPARGERDHRRRGAAPERPRPDRSPSPLPAEARGNGPPPASRLTGAPAPPEPPPASPPAPGATPAPGPAPVPAPPPPQPSPPAPVEPDQPDEPASPPSAGHPGQHQGPSQFGFEH